jgi:hypothetical protein
VGCNNAKADQNKKQKRLGILPKLFVRKTIDGNEIGEGKAFSKN